MGFELGCGGLGLRVTSALSMCSMAERPRPRLRPTHARPALAGRTSMPVVARGRIPDRLTITPAPSPASFIYVRSDPALLPVRPPPLPTVRLRTARRLRRLRPRRRPPTRTPPQPGWTLLCIPTLLSSCCYGSASPSSPPSSAASPSRALQSPWAQGTSRSIGGFRPRPPPFEFEQLPPTGPCPGSRGHGSVMSRTPSCNTSFEPGFRPVPLHAILDQSNSTCQFVLSSLACERM